MALDQKKCVMMALLDLSAAFDTVSHPILLERLSRRYGIRGNAQEWVTSYLSERTQFVTVKEAKSRIIHKHCDVPQGSVLGPSLYEDYTASPLGDIFRKHGIPFHIYADDTQVYAPFDLIDETTTLERLELCLLEVKDWMAANCLKLNESKTEFIVFGSSRNLQNVNSISLKVGDAIVPKTDTVKNIGVHLDNALRLDTQVAALCKNAWYHLHQISKIRDYLDDEQSKAVVHAHVTSRLDSNNSILLGLPQYQINKLQNIQNASARLISGLKKHDHITPTLKSLHWLPIEQHILSRL